MHRKIPVEKVVDLIKEQAALRQISFRPLKFRAWHIELKKMFSANDMGQDQLTISVDGRGFVNVHSASTKLSQFAGDKMIPMQYIGFNDEDDVEIYEGDIVHWEFDDETNEAKPIHFCGESVVQYSDFSAAFQLVDDNEVQDFWNDKELWSFEVIGNVYENPDLMP